MKVALTGSSGNLGYFVLRRLVEDGWSIRALVRNPEHTHQLEKNVEWVVGDMTSSESIAALLEGCTSIVHLGFNHLPGRYRGGEGSDPVAFWNTNFGSTIEMLEQSRRAGVERVVLLSSRAVFDGLVQSDQWVDDRERPRPTTHYGLLKYANEELAHLYENDLTVCTLRPTGVYGCISPIEKSKWWTLVTKFIISDQELESFEDSPRTEVHGADAADAIVKLLAAPANDVASQSFNCSDVVVSERYLVQTARTIADRKGDIQNLNHEITVPSGAQNRMGTRALNSLGWTGGGISKLHATIQELLNY